MNTTLSTITKKSTLDCYQAHFETDRSHWLRVRTVIAFGIGITVAGIAYTQSTQTSPVSGSAILAVQTSTIKSEHQYILNRTYLGRVEATRNTELGFELAGKIANITVDEGDRVTKGQILAKLDIERLQARKEELIFALKQTRANLKLAGITYRRYQQVVESSGVSNQQLDEAKEHFRATQAVLELDKSRIKTIDIEINKSQLTAPFNANITQRRVDEGQVVAAGTPVLQLQENTAAEIRVGIAGQIVESIQAGQEISVVVNQKTLQASVKAIVPVRDGRTRTVDVILSLNQLPVHVRSGDLVRVELAMTIEQSGYWIPISALSEDARGTWSIYTIKQSSTPDSTTHQTVHRRSIEIIHAESDRVFAQGFFENDDQYVAGGLQRIVPGQHVQISTSLARLDTN